MTVKTQDGDTVTLSINANAVLTKEGGAMSMARAAEFSFVVAGNLSDQEREAVDALVSRLGDMAHVYQQDGWADVDFLDAFDGDVIAGFDLNVSGDNDNALTVAYSLNTNRGTHSLAVNQNDYVYKLDADALVDSALRLEDNALYQQYQQLLLDTTHSYKAGEFSGGVRSAVAAQFFLDGLEAILSPLAVDNNLEGAKDDARVNFHDAHGVNSADTLRSDLSHKPPGSIAPKQPQQGDHEREFLSGLPDFSAHFNTPRFTPNRSNTSEVSQMTLDMEQVTEVSLNPGSGGKTLQQRYSYESRVSQHFGIAGDSVRHANLADIDQPGGQTYLYDVVNQSASLTRRLDIDADGAAMAYQEDKDAEHNKTTKEVVGGKIVGIEKEDLSDPQDNYSFSLQLVNSPAELALQTLQIHSYNNIQLLENAIQSQHIDLYS